MFVLHHTDFTYTDIFQSSTSIPPVTASLPVSVTTASLSGDTFTPARASMFTGGTEREKCAVVSHAMVLHEYAHYPAMLAAAGSALDRASAN